MKNKTYLRYFAITGLLFAFIMPAVTLNPKKAQALTGSDFKAGRIIDDGVFFNGEALNASQIQIFLDSKLPACDTNGAKSIYDPVQGDTVTRKVYSERRGVTTPFTCLKDYRQDVPAKAPEDALCNGITARAQQTAAQIIDHVSRSCGVSQKVLLILLQKEQSLVTDEWPWPIQYRSATGYGCPDTAACDAQYYGYFNQVYAAARIYKYYAKYSSSFNHLAGRNNNILFNPNAACGSSSVFVENQATAGLYNYTPYQPNPSALNNLYGSGDGCGAYGNRNFWRMFNDWFGSTYYLGQPYSWAFGGQNAYNNLGRSIEQSSIPTAEPGNKLYLTIKARNTGQKTWYKSSLRLGTINDQTSLFYDTTWLSPSRPTALKEDYILPGETGTLEFAVTAPQAVGAYREYFNLVIDGESRLVNIGQYFEINIVSPDSPPVTTSELTAGQKILPGQYLLSPQKHSVLILQEDGNLVLYENSIARWSTGTAAKSVRELLMQADGNLVLYSTNGDALWNSATNTNSNNRLSLQEDGNLVIYGPSSALWSIGRVHVPIHRAYVINSLRNGPLFRGQHLQTPDRKLRLVFQNDSNLVLYSNGKATWDSGTVGKPGAVVRMQSDGNLVLYDAAGKALWFTETSRNPNAQLRIQQDGNLVIYNDQDLAIWSSRTNGL